jgi:hypothetical protein
MVDRGRKTAQPQLPKMKLCEPPDTMPSLLAVTDRIPRPQPAARDRQTAEIHIRIAIMNRFNALGTAEIFRVA